MATKYKDYKNSKYEEMLLIKYSYNYGISEEKIAKFIVNSGSKSFQKNIVDYYGLTYDNLLSTYIPELKKQLNGGYVFFLLYSYTEGGGAGNWINHETTNTTGNALGDLKADCDYLNSINVGDFPVCMSAPEVYDWTPYVEDKKGETDRVFKKMTKGTLGLMWMVSTMAGNAWVWGTQWSLSHQGLPPAFGNGNPYDIYIGKIIDLGGEFSDNDNPTDSKPNKPSKPNQNNGGGTSTGGGITGNDKNDNTIQSDNDFDLIEKITNNLSKNIDGLFKEIKGKLTNNLFSNNLDNTIHSNKNFIVKKMFNNIVKVKETKFFNKFVNNNVDGIFEIEEEEKEDENIGSGTNDNISNVGGGGTDGNGNQTEEDKETETNNNVYKKPDLNGKYYKPKSTGEGVNECYIIESTGTNLPNCTGYCWGRSYETLGKHPKLPTSNAYEWYAETTLPKGSVPKKGAIICYSGYTYGHVVFIEEVKKDGSLHCSQSDYYATPPTGYSVCELDKNGKYTDHNLTLIGYIYPTEG